MNDLNHPRILAARSRTGSFLTVFLLPLLLAGVGLMQAGLATAQTFTALHSFATTATNASGVYTNSDGANPYAGLTIADNSNTRYGTTANGGSSGAGTIFAVNADGAGFTILHSFTGGSDGANPWAGLVLSGNTLYGTASRGGTSGDGTVFAINTDGTGFTNLHSFIGDTDGAYPNGGLILSGNTLYGTASWEGSSGSGAGTVFALKTDGTGFTVLHNFTATILYPFQYFDQFGRAYFVYVHINGDGAVPVAGLTLSGDTLFGTASGGGSGGDGTVFTLKTDGTGFTIVHSFEPTDPIPPPFPPPPPPGGCFGGGCGAGSQCHGGFCGCAGFCSGG